MSNGYNYIPSYVFKEGSKYQQLISSYQPLFELYIKNKERFDKAKSEELWQGIYHCAEYVLGSFNFMIYNSYDTKTSQDKISTAMYNRLVAVHGNDYINTIQPQLVELAEKAIFYSLGMDVYKNNKRFLWQSSSKYRTLLKHAIEVVFKSLIFDFLKTQTVVLDTYDLNDFCYCDEDADVLSGIDIIRSSGLEKQIPKCILQKLLDFLDNGDTTHQDELMPYLQEIYYKINKLE
ncbi:hypothetical protein ACHJH3_06465 [Campylobacter sp. MOP7]|uniref:hypothetical protein n=1 Tax=Campylobacter canis TaxID=3378588 RepID=UPI00387E945D